MCGEPGEIAFYADPSFVDLIDTWNEPLVTGCPELSIVSAGVNEAQIVASIFPPLCNAIASAPIAYDAAAIVFYLDEAFSITLSGDVIQDIFSGGISKWSDPALESLNPEVVFPDLEINVVSSSNSQLISAMERWSEELSGQARTFNLLQDDRDAVFSDLIYEMPAGSIGLFPLSEASTAGATVANIQTKDAVLLPDQQSIYAASTMFTTETNGQFVAAKFSSDSNPLPSPGTSQPALPYKALVPVTLSICNEDTLAARAVARFTVRLDSQGLIATSTLVGLEEKVRVVSAEVLGEGLPLPEETEVTD